MKLLAACFGFVLVLGYTTVSQFSDPSDATAVHQDLQYWEEAVQDPEAKGYTNEQLARELKALGPSGMRALIDVLGDRRMVNSNRASTILTLVGEQAVPSLQHALKSSDPHLRTEAARALGHMKQPPKHTIPDLLQALKDRDENVRLNACGALAQMGPEAFPGLLAALDDSNTDIRAHILVVFSRKGADALVALPKIKTMVKDREAPVRASAVAALASVAPADKEVIRLAHELTNDSDMKVRLQAIKVVSEIDPNEFQRAVHAFRDHRYPEAVRWFNAALKLEPNQAMSYYLRGESYRVLQDYPRALADFTKALELKPDWESPLAARHYVNLYKVPDYPAAVDDYKQLVAHHPKDAVFHNGFAWLLATCPDDEARDGAEAVIIATRACELSSWKNALIVDTLAAAYAESGDFAKAVKWQKEANDLADGAGTPMRGEKLRLQMYEKRQPYREIPKPGVSTP